MIARLTERPLLALTRAPSPAAPDAPPPDATRENMRQLIQLRWLAVTGQLVTILVVGPGLGVPLPLGTMLLVVATLALVNVASLLALPRHRITNVEILLALLFDTGTLTLQLYLSGGATNPFISLYLVQVAMGVILLHGWSAWVLTATATVSYAVLTVRYQPLRLPVRLLRDYGDLHLLGSWLSFALVATLLVLFITRISRNLRARDTYLAELRRRNAEEDGIIRMGLFASGAAHELGTPLGTIAVILADWRRMPELARHPALLDEIAEMQGEIDRCKTIVTDILHSAGEPRGAAMERVKARAFLDEATTAWAATQPQVPLARDFDGIDDAAVISDPALRQAVWSLLDNAAEASPGDVELHAYRDDGKLVIAISDRGPGFARSQLDEIGRPYRSSKGAGHGVGLFLAVNVARRLGGRLEARNHGDGAEVRLVLPLAPDQRSGG